MKLRTLSYTVLIVEDMERALHFYVDVLGLPFGHRSGGYAQLETGSTRLSLYTREQMQETLGRALETPDAGAPAFEIGFLVEDVDDAYREVLDAGGASVAPPTDRFWGQRSAYVADPDGNLVELVQPVVRTRAQAASVGSEGGAEESD